MKPLQTLDHVMLWIARAYALFYFGFHLSRWIKYATEPAPTLALGSTLAYHGPTIILGVSVLLSGILTAGLFLLGRRLGWLLVIPPALGIMAMSLYELYLILRVLLLIMGSSHIKPSLQWMLERVTVECLAIVIIQLVNIYLALRVPVAGNKDGNPSFPPSLIPHSLS